MHLLGLLYLLIEGRLVPQVVLHVCEFEQFKTLCFVLLQHLPYYVFALGCYRYVGRKADFLLANFAYKFLFIFVVKGQGAAHHGIKHDPYGPHVYGRLGLALVLEALRGHVTYSSSIHFFTTNSCYPEIYHFDGEVVSIHFTIIVLKRLVFEQNVLQFEVAMDYAPVVAVEHGLDSLQDYTASNFF